MDKQIPQGRGMAQAGLIMGIISIVIFILGIIIDIFVFGGTLFMHHNSGADYSGS